MNNTSLPDAMGLGTTVPLRQSIAKQTCTELLLSNPQAIANADKHDANASLSDSVEVMAQNLVPSVEVMAQNLKR